MKISYLNTDLDVKNRNDLTPLAEALETDDIRALFVTYGEDGQWHATFETSEQFDDPQTSISVMLDAIESLPIDAQKLWAECTVREFNIGYDCGDEPWAYNQGLTNATLDRISKAGASFRITLYPPDKSQANL